MGECAVCLEDIEWPENGLLSCAGCGLIVHKTCYGLDTVALSEEDNPWVCDKCDALGSDVQAACELCPTLGGALKRTDNGGWAHIICALFVPDVKFGDVSRREPILVGLIARNQKYIKSCAVCEEGHEDGPGKESATVGAFMRCNKPNCKQFFHATCGQRAGLLCEDTSNALNDALKYCGYCSFHYHKLSKDNLIKPITGFKPVLSHKLASDIDMSKNSRKRKKTKRPQSQSTDLKEYKTPQKMTLNDSIRGYTRTPASPRVETIAINSNPDASAGGDHVVIVFDQEEDQEEESAEDILGQMADSFEMGKNMLMTNTRAYRQRIALLEAENKRLKEEEDKHLNHIQGLREENEVLKESLFKISGENNEEEETVG